MESGVHALLCGQTFQTLTAPHSGPPGRTVVQLPTMQNARKPVTRTSRSGVCTPLSERRTISFHVDGFTDPGGPQNGAESDAEAFARRTLPTGLFALGEMLSTAVDK